MTYNVSSGTLNTTDRHESSHGLSATCFFEYSVFCGGSSLRGVFVAVTFARKATRLKDVENDGSAKSPNLTSPSFDLELYPE